MANTRIMIVDDDVNYALTLKGKLDDIGGIDIVHSEEDFKKVFKPYTYDLVITDLKLKTGKEGLDLLSYCLGEDPTTAVIVISGFGDIATAVEALHKGASTFLEKNISDNELRMKIEYTLKEASTQRKLRHLESAIDKGEIIGDDPKIDKIREMIRLVAEDGETTVLIRGETGTGKELIARAIHNYGIRKDGPFISIALTDLNRDTITSELFGHEAGAFTGAARRHLGCFEQAHKGIIFIDEIGELPMDLQVKLLRVLDSRTFRRMGGAKDIQVDVQVITATNRALEEMLKVEKFREDLYYRLRVVEIHLPPLRERKGDIPLLSRYFLHQLFSKGRTSADGFDDDAMALMLSYKWPGNVRELKSLVESVALRCRLEGSKIITRKHLIPFLMGEMECGDGKKNDNNSIGYDTCRSLAEVELAMIEEALKKSNGKKTEAWKLLSYKNRFVMLRKVKKFADTHPGILDNFPEVKKSYL